MPATLPAALAAAALVACPQPAAIDGDNIRCGGVNLRIVGVNAREADGTCFDAAPCPAMAGVEARRVLEQLVRGGVHYHVLYIDVFGRPVVEGQLADGRDLSCALIASGAALRWDRYWPLDKRCS